MRRVNHQEEKEYPWGVKNMPAWSITTGSTLPALGPCACCQPGKLTRIRGALGRPRSTWVKWGITTYVGTWSRAFPSSNIVRCIIHCSVFNNLQCLTVAGQADGLTGADPVILTRQFESIQYGLLLQRTPRRRATWLEGPGRLLGRTLFFPFGRAYLHRM